MKDIIMDVTYVWDAVKNRNTPKKGKGKGEVKFTVTVYYDFIEGDNSKTKKATVE